MLAFVQGPFVRSRSMPTNRLAMCQATPVKDSVAASLLSLDAGPSTDLSESGPSTDQIDVFACWYPVDVISTLDPTRPHPMQLLGLNLVLWNDGITVDRKKQEGSWHCFDDACPHRLGPLSEGRVEADGNLLCSYHGWRFGGSGECVDLPYALGPSAERQRRSCRASCGSYPTRAVDSLLWVFPRTGPDAQLAADATRMPVLSDEIYDMWRTYARHRQSRENTYRHLEAARLASLGLVGVALVLLPDAGTPARPPVTIGAALIATALHLVKGLVRRSDGRSRAPTAAEILDLTVSAIFANATGASIT